MRKRYTIEILIITILIAFFAKCKSGKKESEIIEAQRVAISELYSPNERLQYEFYEDSIIKHVSILSANKPHGKIVSFHANGKMKNIMFFNKAGEKLGDETNFNLEGIMTEHLFRLDENNLLFYVKFDERNKKYIDGKPWYLHGPEKVKLNDTALYYIATPLIPNFTTKVSFGLLEDSSTTINYLNDLRQMEYKIVMNEIGMRKLKLVVNISDVNQNVLVQDSTTIITEVR